jgi:hypothetical protein
MRNRQESGDGDPITVADTSTEQVTESERKADFSTKHRKN